MSTSTPRPDRVLASTEPLDAGELRRAVQVVRAVRPSAAPIVSVALAEHDHREPVRPRQAEVVWLDRAAGLTHCALVDLSCGTLVSEHEVDIGHAPFVPSEAQLVDALVRADPRLAAALDRRGLVVDQIEIGLFPAGNRALGPAAHGRRVFRTSCWLRDGRRPYTTPVEGIVAVVDVDAGLVLELVDHGVVPAAPPSIDYAIGDPGRLRGGLRALEIVQPDGPSFELDGWELQWQKWRIALGFTPREGLVLHRVSYHDGAEERSILRRASLSEMVVPYAHTSPGHYDRAVFDVGEAMLGLCANELRRGCDCLGLIRYIDAVVNDEHGDARTIPNAICIHEEDDGVLWKHTDAFGAREVRRSRRLVVSWFATLDNYDYGFYWYFRQDGSMEMEVKLTGIVLVEGLAPGAKPRHGALVAPQLNGILHQHFFCFRLHMDVDGGPNVVAEQEARPLAQGISNPHGNAFETTVRVLASESEARRDARPSHARSWTVMNPERRNALGQPTAYTLVPEGGLQPMAQPTSSFRRRAGFAEHALWVTPFAPEERFAAGEFPNLHPGGAGLPAWTRGDRSLDGGDLVLWHTVGHHHLPRPEDWPVMPVACVGFKLKPTGFFGENPANDVAPPAPASAAVASGASNAGGNCHC